MIPTLTDYQTGEAIRPATRDEHQRSREAERENGTGAFLLDGRSVFVSGDFATEPPAPTRLYRVTNPATGVNLGTYAGATKAHALDHYAMTAGYDSFAAACEVTGDDPADDAGLSVIDVTDHHRIEVHDCGRWMPAPGDAGGWTLDEAIRVCEAGVPAMDGDTFGRWRIVAADGMVVRVGGAS